MVKICVNDDFIVKLDDFIFSLVVCSTMSLGKQVIIVGFGSK